MKNKLIILFIALTSCSPKSDFQTIEWKSGSSKENLVVLKQVDTAFISEASLYSQNILLRQQLIRGVPVEGTYVKEISNGSNLVAVRGHIVTAEPKLKDFPIEEFLGNKSNFERRLKNSLPMFKRNSPQSVSLVIAHHKGFYQPLWKVVYVDDKGVTWEARFNNYLQIQKIQRVGSYFQDTLAWVFPKGSKKRELQEVVLTGLYASPTLANTRLMVSSQNSSKVTSVMEPLKFNSKDPRFDQVQAFYFLDDSLAWFERMLGFKIPFLLQAEVQVGFPEKTNSAFYYQGKIRLGAGDDQVYSGLAQDPSVVVHESVHAVVDSIAGLPFEGEGGSLNEGFADFFTAAQLNNPNMGEASYLKGPFRRSVVNTLSVADKNGGLYHDSGIISGVLWDLKEQFGLEKGIRLAALTLARLVPNSEFKDFGVNLHAVLQSELVNVGDLKEGQTIIQKRGF
ncbi:hypothetical protein DOM22_16965 [Bdellovibrio sp. ZAP7]|uniref:M4 family metallopeptidase n=1 Tax=Bdellovibrio sp. ZAP7 TaxID=2231053 RepID=UPI00115BD55B|nr:M4 family metallopeptidase [Bdellovibrio sp. ZAP7]QDK46724.1 hypothetical protein DOM22_16965 [Bdellovibrio sp. ZAP7]